MAQINSIRSNRDDLPAVHWPRRDYSRVPFHLYHDPEIYRLEQELIFKGPAWSFVGLEAEIPNPGDFRTTYVGETPIILARDLDGTLHAMVNRCAHRGAMVRREAYGNAKDHTCIYHRWCYGLDGSLLGLPFRRGLKGKGGMSPDFDMADHGLQRLRVAVHAGVIFASFSAETEPLADYLGPVFRGHFDRIFARPIRILGYQRQRIYANWKLYLENQRDTYHGTLLHEFQSTFGLSRATQTGGVTMDDRHRHNLTWSKIGTDDEAEFASIYKENKVHETSLVLEDPALIEFKPEFADGISLAICGIFPNATVHQISNSLATRQLRTFGPGEFELLWTLFGYQDDTPAMTDHRLLQANLVGPAGLISMEDGEAIEITQRATIGDADACSVIEMGGGGSIRSLDHRVNDVPCRGFWSYYAELMGIEPEGAETMNDVSIREAADELMYEYALRIDDDRLEDWLDLFTDDARYEIVPRENVEQNLPVSIILCTNKKMMRDRIVSLRNANEYNLHYDRHAIGHVRVVPHGDAAWRLEANFAVYQTNLGGQTRLFSVGCYRDKVRFQGDRLLFVEKRIIVDTFSVPTLLATPL